LHKKAICFLLKPNEKKMGVRQKKDPAPKNEKILKKTCILSKKTVAFPIKP